MAKTSALSPAKPPADLKIPKPPRKRPPCPSGPDDYTGEQTKRKRPKDYRLAVKMLGGGCSKKQIAATLGMAPLTVSAIERREIQTIADRRRYLGGKAFVAASASLDSATERALDGKSSALDAKLLNDTWLSLAGEPTSVVEVHHHFPQLSEFEKLTGGKVIDVESSDAV
jgi:hypothetical protein